MARQARRDATTTAVLLAALLFSGGAPAEPFSASRDDFLVRVEALALVETLNADLLAGRSATATLEAWCADHRMAPEPKIAARLLRGVETPPSDEQRRRLAVGPEETVRHRRVQLVCGAHVLSEADNWYVPGRLTSEMNRRLDETDAPFGRVVSALQPFRRTFAVRMRWSPLPKGWEQAPKERLMGESPPGQRLAPPRELFEHRALVLSADQRPIAEVRESYTREILDFEAP
jgi:chorismate-pyruvate lyase